MACLPVFEDGIHVVCANPIFPTLEIGTSFTFEVLEADAGALKGYVGEVQHRHIDSNRDVFRHFCVAGQACSEKSPRCRV